MPLFAFVASLVLARRAGGGIRYTFLLAAVVWSVFLTVLTELLSYFYALTATGLAVGWALFGLACFWLASSISQPKANSPSSPLDASEKFLISGLALLFGIVAVTALVAAPNTWDAMSYHLPRIVLWASNHSVELFPTPDYSQVLFQTWAEFAMLHAYLLWGSDRLVNLVEFASLVGTTIAVSAIASTFGATRLIQIVAAIISATIPEGVLEASGAMNTYVGAFWVTVAAYFVLSWNRQPTWINLLAFSAATGLASLTKGTAYVFLPFVLLGCWWIGSSKVRWLLLARMPVAALLAIAINLPHFLRSYRLTGSPLGFPFPEAGPRLHWTGEYFSVTGTLANTIRNLALHLGTPFEAINRATLTALTGIIRLVGEDPNDPRVIWQGTHFDLNHLSRHEILAGNPWHLALIFVAVGIIVVRREQQPIGIPTYALGVAGAFLLFSGLLKWQPWAARHHLALFALMAPVVAIAFGNLLSQRKIAALAVLLLVCSTPFALANRLRSLVPIPGQDDLILRLTRTQMYMLDQHQQDLKAYAGAASMIRNSTCGKIGIDAVVDGSDASFVHDPLSFYVYPLMAMAGAPTKLFRYIDVKNSTAAFSKQNAYTPCLIVCLDCVRAQSKWLEYRDWDPTVFDSIVIFAPKK